MSCDIIIPVWNRLELTKKCIDSILRYTKPPHRLIIIDNCSDSETAKYLKGLKSIAGLNLELIRNEENLGFVKAINQGLRISSAEYTCLLNNDTEVTQGWLEELISVVGSNSRIGIVNPGAEADTGKRNGLRGKCVEIGFASGFCMLIKKEVKDKVGLLDEDYQQGFWEETDYCQRAKKAGYICVSAKGAYVFHHGHKSFDLFKKDDVNYLFERNKGIFTDKWGKILQIAYVFFRRDISPDESSGIMKLAKDGHMVYMFFKSSAEIKANIDHGSIRRYKTPGIFFYIYVTGKILIRQMGKKGFNRIFTDNPKFARCLVRLNPSLNVEII